MGDHASGEKDLREVTTEPSVSNESWGLPLPVRRSHRRLFQLLAAAVVLLMLLGVVRWHLAGKAPPDPIPVSKEGELEVKGETKAEAGAESAPAELLTDVVVYLTFEPNTLESTKLFTIVKDLSGRGHHGILYGAKPTEKGKVGGGVALDGNDSYVELPTLNRAEIGTTGSVTIGLWTYETRYHAKNSLFSCSSRRDIGGGLALARDAESRQYSLIVPWRNERLRSEECGAQQWHHVVGVCSEQGIEIYIDGQRSSLTAVAIMAGSAKRPSPPKGLGAFLGRGYEGTIDELLIFRRRLLAGEVASLYQMGLAGRRPAPRESAPALGAFLTKIKEVLTLEDEPLRKKFNGPRRGQIRTPDVDSCRLEQEAYVLTPDGQSLLVGHRWGWVSQEYLDGGRPSVTERVQPLGERLHGLVMSPDGHRVACYGGTGQICLWDYAKAAPVAHFDTSLESVLSAGFNEDGSLLAVAGRLRVDDSGKGAVGLWDVDTFRAVRRFSLPGLEVTAVAVSSDGSCLAAASTRDKQIHLLDAKSGRLLRSLPATTDEVTRLLFLPEGRRFLSAGDANTIWFWDGQTGQQIGVLSGHFSRVTCLDVSPDGQKALSGSNDGTMRAWNLQGTGNPRSYYHVCYPIGYSLRHVAFSSDGSTLSAGTVYGDYYRFNVPTIPSGDAAGAADQGD